MSGRSIGPPRYRPPASKRAGPAGPSTKLIPVEFRIWRLLTANREKVGDRLIVACSGGADSVAAVEIFARLAPRLGVDLHIATVHHGRSPSRQIERAREAAVTAAGEMAAKWSLPFHPIRRVMTGEVLVSEAALREFRLGVLRALADSLGGAKLVLAHHADDLFETRLIRLIRGTGPQGLEAMRFDRGDILRPLLRESRADLRGYARARELAWCEDPTNASTDALRNWLRIEWLPQLERRRAGAPKAFARSLEQLAETTSQDVAPVPHPPVILDDETIRVDRRKFLRLQNDERAREIAALLLTFRTRDFTSAHIAEIQKRLRSERSQEFSLLRLQWRINAEQIIVKKIAHASAPT